MHHAWTISTTSCSQQQVVVNNTLLYSSLYPISYSITWSTCSIPNWERGFGPQSLIFNDIIIMDIINAIILSYYDNAEWNSLDIDNCIYCDITVRQLLRSQRTGCSIQHCTWMLWIVSFTKTVTIVCWYNNKLVSHPTNIWFNYSVEMECWSDRHVPQTGVCWLNESVLYGFRAGKWEHTVVETKSLAWL